MTDDAKKPDAPREWWIHKGTSNFCSELVLGDDFETMIKKEPDGFYDIVSLCDTIKGGIHVVEYSALEQAQTELETFKKSALEKLGKIAAENILLRAEIKRLKGKLNA